jgi:hypothetical protein
VALTVFQKRFLELYTKFKTNTFTLKDAQTGLHLATNGFLHGRRLPTVLNDLLAQKLLVKRNAVTFQFTTKAQTLASENEPEDEPDLAPNDFMRMLREASTVKRHFSEHKVNFQAPPRIEDQKLFEDIVIPKTVPVAVPKFKENPKSNQEALHFFELNFSENPDQTVKDLANLVLTQRIKLESQDRLLHQMYELLRDYVYKT